MGVLQARSLDGWFHVKSQKWMRTGALCKAQASNGPIPWKVMVAAWKVQRPKAAPPVCRDLARQWRFQLEKTVNLLNFFENRWFISDNSLENHEWMNCSKLFELFNKMLVDEVFLIVWGKDCGKVEACSNMFQPAGTSPTCRNEFWTHIIKKCPLQFSRWSAILIIFNWWYWCSRNSWEISWIPGRNSWRPSMAANLGTVHSMVPIPFPKMDPVGPLTSLQLVLAPIRCSSLKQPSFVNRISFCHLSDTKKLKVFVWVFFQTHSEWPLEQCWCFFPLRAARYVMKYLAGDALAAAIIGFSVSMGFSLFCKPYLWHFFGRIRLVQRRFRNRVFFLTRHQLSEICADNCECFPAPYHWSGWLYWSLGMAGRRFGMESRNRYADGSKVMITL